ncbi:MAG TPA: alpha-glucan family phosphorylase, partial [Gammaproteobacteria bacterium]|nr:alpha-glucan family phosphorylase [Gammaproteobacteria bacterium]
MTGTLYSLEVRPTLPERLSRLEELSNDLMYSWDRAVRRLFFRLDRDLWDSCGHNPKIFLHRVSQKRLEQAAEDPIYIEDYNRVLSVYDSYHSETSTRFDTLLNPDEDLIAYFCAEFGLHESVPLYSGGLGILAGDHCKAASDLRLPFVAVGILYRQGYFTQLIDAHGNQVAHYSPIHPTDLPIKPALDAEGKEVYVSVTMPGRQVKLKVWKAKAGHITLYLLDSDLQENNVADRSITYQLYGGDINTRMQQEVVLGIGGVRALRAVGLNPTVWHINEGHSAFMVLERSRELVGRGFDFDSAMELVSASTVFTTHTPVPAGHDIFDHHLMSTYFADYIKELKVDMHRFLELGSSPVNNQGFNQTALALRGSRFHNGVSRIHGGVASNMESYIWPQIPPDENPIGYVTNGVHVPTFLAREWINLFDMRFGGEWRNELRNDEYWERIDDIPDQSYWSLRQTLKSELLDDVRRRVFMQLRRNECSEVQIERATRYLHSEQTDILTIGFARRFATYKRSTLLFTDPERLERLLADQQRPVVILFAGKAHPNDAPGQQLIKAIHDFTRRPGCEGKVILLEDYDLALARKLVMGVDVWLNNPEYPLEASGTSGQKVAINGGINLSVLDGWWDEGYNGANGWAITPHGEQHEPAYRDREEAYTLLEILEEQVVPLYYKRDKHGFSSDWVRLSKASMK